MFKHVFFNELVFRSKKMVTLYMDDAFAESLSATHFCSRLFVLTACVLVPLALIDCAIPLRRT